MLEKSARTRKVRNALRQSSDEELEKKEKAEEFWADTCWTEPLDKGSGRMSQKDWKTYCSGRDPAD